MTLVSQKLRESARGQECTLRLPGVCQGGTETTVLCHLRSGIGAKGMAMKVPDYWAVFGCNACHNALDERGGGQHMFGPAFLWGALQRTWAIWFESDPPLLRVAGDDDKPRTKPASSKILPRRAIGKGMP